MAIDSNHVKDILDSLAKGGADLLAKVMQVKDPAAIAAIEDAAPKIVDATFSIYAAIVAIQAAKKPVVVAKVAPKAPPVAPPPVEAES